MVRSDDLSMRRNEIEHEDDDEPHHGDNLEEHAPIVWVHAALHLAPAAGTQNGACRRFCLAFGPDVLPRYARWEAEAARRVASRVESRGRRSPDADHDLAEVIAARDPRVRLGRVGERIRLVEDGSQPRSLDGAREALE